MFNKSILYFTLRFKSLFPFHPKNVISSTTNKLTTTQTPIFVKNKFYTKDLLLFLTLWEVFKGTELKYKRITDNNNNFPSSEKNRSDVKILLSTKKIITKQRYLKKKSTRKLNFIRAPYKGKNAQVQICQKFFFLDWGFSIHIPNKIFSKKLFTFWALHAFKFFNSNHFKIISKEVSYIFLYNFNFEKTL